MVYMAWTGDVAQCISASHNMFNFEACGKTCNLCSGCNFTPKISDPSLIFSVYRGHMVGVLYILQAVEIMENCLSMGHIFKKNAM